MRLHHGQTLPENWAQNVRGHAASLKPCRQTWCPSAISSAVSEMDRTIRLRSVCGVAETSWPRRHLLLRQSSCTKARPIPRWRRRGSGRLLEHGNRRYRAIANTRVGERGTGDRVVWVTLPSKSRGILCAWWWWRWASCLVVSCVYVREVTAFCLAEVCMAYKNGLTLWRCVMISHLFQLRRIR